MPGDDPVANLGGSAAALAMAQAGMTAQAKKAGGGATGSLAGPTSNWWDRTISSYRAPGGIEAFPWLFANLGRTFTSGVMFGSYFAPTPAERAELPTITNVEVNCMQIGSGVTLCQIGIWDYVTNALLAQTADFSGTLAVAALNRALQTPLAMPVNPFWVGILPVFTTTSPGFVSLNAPGSAGGNMSHVPLPSFAQGSLAALPATLVPGPTSAVIWFGLN